MERGKRPASIGLALMVAGLAGAVSADAQTCPNHVTTISTGTNQGFDLAVEGDYAYFAGVIPGMAVIDVSNPGAPSVVGSFQPSGGLVIGVDVAGTLAYATDSFLKKLYVVDVSDPMNPTELGSVDTPGTPWDVDVAGVFAFVTEFDAGLRVINISDPTNPTVAGFLPLDSAWKIAVVGDIAYIGGSGLYVIDVSAPESPSQIGFLPGLGCGLGLDVVGNRVYYGGCSSGLHVIGVSDPTAPTLLGTAPAFDESRGIKVMGGVAYVAGYQGGLRVIDVTDESAPIEIGSYVTTYAAEIGIKGTWVLMALYDGSLVSFDISVCPDGGLFVDGFESGDTSAWSSSG